MEEKVKISILCDLYGKMLTETQLKYISDFYNNDLSLTEIAENNNVSRQAVKDMIDKSTKKLLDYEEKLGLMKINFENKKIIEKIKEKIDEIEDENTQKNIEQIKKLLNRLK